ncbi:MAG: SDR family oxidoreductase [Lachnospiraceae bacterium]|nr:SDR family oxidoreductase [Lachnospiraceae bacterium]
MKILITGSNGFIAKNLIAELRNRGYEDLLLCNRSTSRCELEGYIEACDFLIHLAGVNRPASEMEYDTGNAGFTEEIVKLLESKQKRVPVIYSSTLLNTRHKAYGESKRKAEKILQEYARQAGAPLYIFRLPNVFGKWCRPNYNSFVATFCYNAAHDLKIEVHDPDVRVTLVYIDDVVHEFLSCLERKQCDGEEYPQIPEGCDTTVGEVAARILAFKKGRDSLEIPGIGDALGKKLYSTYLSYLEPEEFSYKLKMNQDERGSFTEFLHLNDLGQISVNVAKPGIVKGNHWHNTKVEKFLVVSGKALIKFRHMVTGEMAEYMVSGNCLEMVDIPVGYTHSIANIGEEDLVTIMWANEMFDPEKPDTYYEEV